MKKYLSLLLVTLLLFAFLVSCSTSKSGNDTNFSNSGVYQDSASQSDTNIDTSTTDNSTTDTLTPTPEQPTKKTNTITWQFDYTYWHEAETTTGEPSATLLVNDGFLGSGFNEIVIPEDITAGDTITIEYTGYIEIAESFPARIYLQDGEIISYSFSYSNVVPMYTEYVTEELLLEYDAPNNYVILDRSGKYTTLDKYEGETVYLVEDQPFYVACMLAYNPRDLEAGTHEKPNTVVSYSYTQNNEYYSSAKFVSNTYYHSLSYEFGEWYKIVKSYDELVQIDSETTVDSAIFEENYILVVHRHYNGGMQYDYIGYKKANKNSAGFEITLDCYMIEEERNDQYCVVESVEYLVIPKTELENVSALEGKLTLNFGERRFYTRAWHSISEEKTSKLENGNVWIFKNPTEYVEFMEAYGVSHPIYGSALKDYTRVVIYFEKGTNIGIGYSNCNVTENEFYITNETLESDNVVLLEPALCVIIIPKQISFDEISKYNIIVQENIIEK